MELFSEIYGAYYGIVESILRNAPLTREKIKKLVSADGFAESSLQLVPNLLNKEKWPLLEEHDGKLYSRLLYSPRVPLTILEKRWLKAALLNPRARLFLDTEQFECFQELLADVKPLFDWNSFRFFDRYLDGDDYSESAYVLHFRKVLRAIREQCPLQITFKVRPNTAYERTSQGIFLPFKLEYSQKDDKFRVYCVRIVRGKRMNYALINIGRILDVQESTEPYVGRRNFDRHWEQGRCTEPVTVIVSRERNAVERFLVEFSAYEKQCKMDEKTGECEVRIWYQKSDETEVLIKILGFGPVVKVESPACFLNQIRHRVHSQGKYMVF